MTEPEMRFEIARLAGLLAALEGGLRAQDAADATSGSR